jgi:kynurenine formamidase
VAVGTAWGVFDKDGKKDVYGTLNHITPDVLKSAYSELKDGVSVSLNWPIGAIKTPGFGRKGLVHKVMSFVDTPLAAHGYDDEVEFNTQCSSQWDSLCHFHHQATAKGYNGIQTNIEELTQMHGDEDTDQRIPTLNHWHKRGGLVARAVFIDWKKWADESGKSFEPFTDSKLSIDEIETIAKKQGVEFKPGDVIIIRSGFTEGLGGKSGEEQEKLMGTHKTCGVTGTPDAAKWFWNKRFAAVAGDMIAFEHIPPVNPETGKEDTVANLVLHQYFLAQFGMPIGELWDLKALSEMCEKLGRYSFLLTSVPLNVPGGIGSPPNALALF